MFDLENTNFIFHQNFKDYRAENSLSIFPSVHPHGKNFETSEKKNIGKGVNNS